MDELIEMHEQEQDIEELESLDLVQSEDRMMVGNWIEGFMIFLIELFQIISFQSGSYGTLGVLVTVEGIHEKLKPIWGYAKGKNHKITPTLYVELELRTQNCSNSTLALENQDLNEEFQHYLWQAVVLLKYDPILYWQEQKSSIYHHVHSIAMIYVSIVGSSVTCEYLFSTAGNIASEERNRLNPIRLDRLLFLKSLDIKLWEL
ncbi:zinc finger BED domain-containing protein 4-like [Trichonephila clavipes]|nr:zinc finger BED domain-containing protein 4-like [Trichonephila clavipes]